MAKTIAAILGVVFIIVGVAGFFSPGLGGAHLSRLHNGVHLASGALALYFGTVGSLKGAKAFCIIFGLVYLLLGAAGMVLGAPGTPTMVGMAMGPDSRLFVVVPGQLELGARDHLIHLVLGAVFFFSGVFTKSSEAAA